MISKPSYDIMQSIIFKTWGQILLYHLWFLRYRMPRFGCLPSWLHVLLFPLNFTWIGAASESQAARDL